MYGVTDKYGFVNEGYYLAVVIPYREQFFLTQIRKRLNRGYEVLRYGTIQYDAGAGTGIVPGASFFPSATEQWFLKYDPVQGLENVPDVSVKKDIFYHEEKRKLFHVKMRVEPEFLKHIFFYPDGQPQVSFRGQTALPSSDFGTFSGWFEFIRLPKIYQSFRTFNETNLNVRTNVTIFYAEYEHKPIADESQVLQILKKRWARIITLPLYVRDDDIDRSLEDIMEVPMFDIDLIKGERLTPGGIPRFREEVI